MAEVIMPKMGDAMEVGKLLSWKKQNGEEVRTGDVIAEIETDKSNVEIEAEANGVLITTIDEGTEVPVGTTIATIGGSTSTSVYSEAAQSNNGHTAVVEAPPILQDQKP
jgi:pyruvate/2-oxoglutarate dehydrogenase complex dihydrolipoamide acyltransferase (E2) component